VLYTASPRVQLKVHPQTHMKKNIVNKPSREQHTLINLSLPLFQRTPEIHHRLPSLHPSAHSQSRKRRPLKRHRRPARHKPSHHHKLDLIVTSLQMLRYVKRVIVPDQWTAASWSECDTFAVDEELVARVCCAVDEC